MDPVLNPYTPGAGVSPAELAGRESYLMTVRVAIERMRRRLPAQSVLLVGLRGVGKTVLLDRMREEAVAAGIRTVRVDAVGERSLPALLAPELRLVLLHLSRAQESKEASLRALRALAGFALA